MQPDRRARPRHGANAVTRRWLAAALQIAVCAVAPSPASAQDQIPDIDYEYLSFRGIGIDWGYMWPDRVEPTQTFGLRFDLGYAGPGLRIVPSIGYWKTSFESAEIAEFETRLEQLVEEQTGVPTSLDLGSIEYSDISVGLDGHIVWSLPLGLLTYGGLGFTAHIQNGAGPAIDDTFIEDVLDSVTAGFNLHLGGEVPVSERLRVYSVGRYVLTPDLRYFRAQAGVQLMFGPNAPGEIRGG